MYELNTCPLGMQNVLSGLGCVRFREISHYISDIPLMCFALYILFNCWSALHITARGNNVEAVKLLLLHGANVNATTTLIVSISVS
jgi:hypothetical protein